MKTWIAQLCAVVIVALVFLGAGVLIGAKKDPLVIEETPRFQKISDTTALDTKLGKVCSTVSGIQIDPQTGERVQNAPFPCAE